jgi:hypothetical protein
MCGGFDGCVMCVCVCECVRGWVMWVWVCNTTTSTDDVNSSECSGSAVNEAELTTSPDMAVPIGSAHK